MSRRKKNTYNPKLITYKEAEQKYGPGGTGGHVMSFDEAQKRQQDYINRIQRMREQQAERERKNRVVSQYQMNRANPAPWMNGGPAARMQAGLDRMQQAEEQKEQKTPGFQDWSMVSNLMNPKSGVNRVIATRPQEEQDYWQGVRQDIGKTLDRGKGNDRAAQLLRPLTPEERLKQRQAQAESMMRVAQGQPVNPLQDPRQYAQEMYDIRALGSDQTGDPLMMNRAQLVAWRKHYQNKLDQATRTDEQQAILHGRKMEAGEQHEVYRQLNERGLPVEINRGKMSLPEADQWESLPDEYFIKKRPEEYYRDDNAKYEYDKMMYDAIHGRGAYDAIALNDDATDEDIDALDAEVEHLWRQLEGGNFNVEERAAQEGYFNAANRENDTRTGGYQRNINLADRYIGNWDRVAELEAGAPEGTYEYDPSKVNHNISLESGEADQLYYYANIDLSDEDMTDFQRYGNLRPEQFMTDAQRNIFNAYYENGQYAEATAYYKAMEPYLRQMKNEYRTLLEQRMYNNGWSIPMTMYRIASKPAEGAVGLVMSGAALAGADWATDPNSAGWDISRTNANIQNTSADAWARQAAKWFGGGDKGFAAWAARQLNGVMFSIADNLTAFALSGGASKVSADAAEKLTQYAIQFIMSSEATAGTMFEQLESGADPTRAGIMAFGSGIIEAITEKYSLETILDPDARAVLGTKGALMGYLGKASLAEGSEEIASDLLDTGLDFIMSAAYGDAPELIRQYEDLIAQGVKPNDATRQVLLGYLEQLGTDGLAGALSGLLMSGSRAFQARGLDNYQTRSIGNTVTNQGVEKGMSAKEKSGAQYSNFMKLNEAAKMLQPGSEARRIAQEIEADVKKGGTVSMKKAGKLTRAIMKESNEQIGQVAEAVLGDTLTKQLTDEGIAPEDAARYSAVLREAVETGRMTPEAMLILSEDERARNLWSEIVKSEDVKSAQKAQKSVMELMTGKDFSEKGVQEKDIAARMAVADWLRDGDAELAEAQGERTGDADEVVANGRIGKIEGFGVREFKGADGQKHWAVTATIRSGSETFEADLSDVQATSENEAKLLQFLNEENGQSIGANVSAALVKTAVTAKDMAGAVTDAVNIVMSQFTGKEIKVTTLNKTEEAQIRQAAEEDIRAEDAEAARSAKALRPGQGKVTYDGMMYGTKQFAEATGKLSAAVRDEMDYVARMMKAVGMDTEFYYDEEESANQGVFIGGEGIRINLAGTFDKDGTHRSAVATAGHESLHWLRANSPEAYRQMRSFVLNHLEDAGYNIADEAKRITANYARHGEFLTIGKAIEEMVAMANERVLTDETLVTQLQEEAPTVYSKVRQAVKRALDMLRRVMGGTKATSSRYAAALDSTLNDIAKVWKLMLDQSQGTKATGEKTGTAAHSIQMDNAGNELSEGQKQFFKNSMAVDREGNLVRLYHGTTNAGFYQFAKTDDIGYFFTDFIGTASTYSDTEDVFAPSRAESWDDVNNVIREDGYEYRKGEDGKYRLFRIEDGEDMSYIAGTYNEGDYDTAMKRDVWDVIAKENNNKLNYAVYANMTNPLVIEGNDSNWNGVVDGTDGDMYEWDELTEEQQEQIADNMGMTLEEAEAQGWTEDGSLEVAAYDVKNMEIRDVMTTREWVQRAKDEGYDGVIFRDIQDEGQFGGGMPMISDVYVVMNPNQVKSVNNLNPTAESNDIRYSFSDSEIRKDNENQDSTADLIMNSKGEVLAQQLPGNSYTMNSWRTWEKEDIKELTEQLVKRGFEGKDVRKWIQDVNNIAKYIVDHKDTLDYEASPYFTMLKNNQEYVKTLDASTLCAKRLLYQGIFNEIQRQMPNTPLMPEDLIKLINMMKKKGLTTPCGFCYVESRRKQLGKYAQQFLDGYKGDSTGYKPKIYDVTTTDGLEKLRTEHPEAYDAFVAAMNAKGSANPKVVQTRTEYRGEIRDMTDGQIRKVKEIGGLRVQSFSDFEIVHMIDMMQAVLDMASKELTSQAYTKVPEFAWVFGDTGMKINLSLVGQGTGVDENGNLIFDNVEGMDYEKAMELRKRYSKNVGTILVGMNEQHIIAAMGDDSIDFIIPFHKSGWNKKEMTQINGMSSYKDFTRWQNEKRIGSWTASGVKTIPNKKSGIRNFGPVGPNASWDGQNGYWDFKKSGEENARKYLQLCKEDGRVPKFANFLEYDGEGGYRLPEGSDKRSSNIRKGYWKLLIDFKMYDNEGNGSPQTNVRADFNMEAAMDILQKYDGNANTLPKDQEVADRFVKEYKSEHPRRSAYSIMDETDYDVRSWLESVPEWSLTSEAEKALLGTYKSLRVKQGLDRLRMQKIDSDLRKLGNQLKKTAEAEGNPERTVTVEEALAAANVKKQGGKLYYKGQLIGTLKYGLLNLTKKAGGVAEELHKSGAFDYDAETETWNTKPQNIHNDDEREIRRQIAALDIRKQNLQTVMDQDTKKLNEILGSKGFGRMMHQQQKMLQNMQNYGTQKELHEHVSQMEETAARIDERIRENKAAVDRIAKTDAMKRVQEILESTTAKEAAASLKREYHSNWTQAEILPYISGIMAKMSAGEDFMNDVEDLAEIMITSDTRNVYEGLSALQGLTITIGKSMQKELKARNSSLNEIRRKLEGTGIRVKIGATSTLDTDVEDLRAEYPDMPEMGNDLDALDRFIEWVNGMRGRTEDEFFPQYKAEAAANIMQKIAAVMKNGQLYVPKDAKARQQIMDLVEYMKTLNAETAAAQKTLAEVAGQLEELKRSGRAAETKANALMKDVNVALDYYNRISRIAVDEAKRKRTSAEIEQLKSKHAEEIAKRNEEWRDQIQRDKDAQKVADDLRKTANKMGTALTRTYNLLKAPKGLNNVPEYMQGAAREMLRMFVENDSAEGYRVKLTKLNREQLEEAQRLRTAWEKQSGKFDVNDLKAAQANEWVMQIVQQDFLNLRDGIEDINREYRGKNRLDTLQHRLEILKGIQEAVSEIYGAIRAEQEVQIGDRKAAVEDAAFDVETGTGGRKYREWTGTMGAAIRNMNRFIVKGNMTPEYFFRTLGNKGLTALWDTYHWAENRNGLELQKAQERLAEIAEKHGYKTWDMEKKVVLHLQGGDTEITLGQLMSLWATWKREKNLGPQMSEHLTKGGFFAEKDLRDGILGRTVMEKKAHRVTEEDMNEARELMTEEQRKFVDDVVLFMSRDMSKLGNEASMAAYGIKLYKEEYYFPFQMWDGVKARKSNESGGAAAANDRAFHPSFSKSRIHGANNALVLGDFMKTATDHIAGMINYATMGLANESMQKVLNQTTEDMNGTKRNVRAVIEEAYGMEAAKYLADLQQQLNGGAVRIERTAYDKLISLFRKNAVAGSLSVALQQPLSYIRAGMMINPKYLARAMSPDMWKGSYKEMMAHSGVAVIKAMGRFDMNAGQSAREYLTPEGLESKGQKVWNAIGEYATILPEKMDAMTWTRMWSAVKAEQHAEHPDMDVKSDKFLDMVGVRFNDLMRRTQVYDSTLVRSANMRSQNPWMKSLTSFMAEPSLTLNVLADAVRMAKNREAGGMTMLAKAGATFILSAVLQAAVKGFMGARRNPDEKKTWEENFWYRFSQNLMGEANPLSLIPGYGDLVTLLKKGELADDAMGALGKLIQAAAGTKDVLAGLISGEERDWYKDVENSGAQLVQLFTNIPLKNLMRDARAMWNWVGTNPYADRETSGAVIRMQTEQAMLNADSLLSAALQAAGFKTTNTAYYQRIYEAKKNGNEREAQDLIDYLLKGKGVKAEKIESGIASAAKGDTGASAADTAEFLIAEGANAEDYIRDRMRKRELTAEEARELLQKADPKKDADTIWWTVDRIQYQMETGAEKGPGGYYYRLTDAINGGTSTDIKDAVKELKAHGVTDKKIQDKLSDWKKEYLSATGNEKVKLKNALIMAYKAAGMSETEANERINKWK